MITKASVVNTDEIKAQYITYCKKTRDDNEICIRCLSFFATYAVFSNGQASFLHCGC
ncbi:hypothetical protein [Jeotgalibacillus marinus]|uniref:Uncharacterized protein n=1 Tax=Jeotgalibacillus marinus TaxID=86667 RepID=A0ABV3Q6J0_9BACL